MKPQNTSEPMDSNSQTTPPASSSGSGGGSIPAPTPPAIPLDSTTAFANDPLCNLLRLRKDRPVMSDEERRQAVMQLRELRTSPQALGRAMRQSAAQKLKESSEEENELDQFLDSNVSVPQKKKSAGKQTSTADLYKELGL